MIDPSWDLENLVTVGTFGAPWGARLAQARLAAEGIHAVVADENLGSLYGGAVCGGVKLRVREEDVVRAVELLASECPIPEIYLVTEEEARRPRCPTCKSDDISPERWGRLFSRPAASRRWSCRHCGAVWSEEPEVEPELEAAVSDPDLVTVARFRTPWEAHLARTLLQSQEIEACVMEERFPPLDLLTGQPLALNRLAVHPDDADRALEVLSEVGSSGAQEIRASES